MPNGVTNRQKRAEQLHKKRSRAALAAPLAGKEPCRAVPVPTKPKRLSASRSVAPLGRGDK
jgi:hypothetical protein